MLQAAKPLGLKDWSAETITALLRLAKSRTEEKRLVEQAQMVVFELDQTRVSVETPSRS